MSETLRADFTGIPTPKEMASRPVDHRGFPVPWFVTQKTEEGHWDFVRIHADRFKEAVRNDVCWVSGVKLGRYRSYVIGPMCVVNRVSADPCVKANIAEWSARVCPFLTRPMARRDRSIATEEYQDQRGVMIERNPGVCAIYTVAEKVTPRGGLFHLPEPVRVEWWTEGRRATREEVRLAMREGLPTLVDMAIKESDQAVRALDSALARAYLTLPQPDLTMAYLERNA